MAQERGTAPVEPAEPRLTSRQRRIEEQRGRIDAYRGQQRRKRALWGTGILVASLVVIALTFLLIKPPTEALGRQMPIEGQDHVPDGSAITYRTRPPTSGPHFNRWADYGFADREIPSGNWVHNLEHGAIVVLYRPDLCDQACRDVLQQTYVGAPRSSFGNIKMVVTSYRDMDHKVAVVAWGWVDEIDEPDQARIIAFYRAHVDRGPESLP